MGSQRPRRSRANEPARDVSVCGGDSRRLLQLFAQRASSWNGPRRSQARRRRAGALRPAAAEDYFHEMDYNVVHGRAPSFTQAEIEGRNMWMVWTGGNDRLWDRLTRRQPRQLRSAEDHLVASRELGYGRRNRWRYLGLVNEPCFTEANGPDPNRYGLWLDVRDPGCPPDPFANADEYRAQDRRTRRPPSPSAPITASRPASSACVCFRIRTSTRRRGAAVELRNGSTTIRLLLRPQSGPAVPRRHVVRVLPRRSQSDQAAGGS